MDDTLKTAIDEWLASYPTATDDEDTVTRERLAGWVMQASRGAEVRPIRRSFNKWIAWNGHIAWPDRKEAMGLSRTLSWKAWIELVRERVQETTAGTGDDDAECG